MKKLFFIICIFPMMHISCNQVETSTSFGIDIDDFIFARMDDQGVLQPVDPAVFKRGEDVNMVLLDVGKFKQDEEGFCWFDMDMLVTGPEGDTVTNIVGLLGEEGHLTLENGIAATPNATLFTKETFPPGTYRMKITIYDKIGKGKATKAASFTLE